MKVEFLKDVFNSGTKVYEAGKQYEGELARYVRRGEAVEVSAAAKAAGGESAEQAAEPKGSKRGKK